MLPITTALFVSIASYCLWRERWCADGDQMFSVDHLWPRMTHPERLCDYDNLVYACCQCNAFKQDAPRSSIRVKKPSDSISRATPTAACGR